MHVMLMRTIGG
jgi:hypothetical protein